MLVDYVDITYTLYFHHYQLYARYEWHRSETIRKIHVIDTLRVLLG